MLHLSDKSIKSQIRYLLFHALILNMLLISVIVFYYWTSSIDETLIYSQDATTQTVLEKIKSFINIPLRINETNRDFLEKGLVDINDQAATVKFFSSVMHSADDNVYSFSYGTIDGNYFGVRRNRQNELEFMMSSPETNHRSTYYALSNNFTRVDVTQRLDYFDPRTRDWYISAAQNENSTFSAIYQHFVMKDLAISASCPIFDQNDHLIGVLGTHITLSKLNDELKNIVQNKKAQAYILEKKTGNIIANSEDEANFTTDAEGKLHRINIEDIQNPPIKNAYHSYIENDEENPPTLAEAQDFYIKVSEFNGPGIEWLIITAIPENTYTIAIQTSLRISIILSLIILLLSAYVCSKKIDKYLLPVYELIKTTQSFAEGDFSSRAKTAENNEIGILGSAFNHMAEHLSMLINNLEQKVTERTAELKQKNETLLEATEKLEQFLQIDFLTGLYNRRFIVMQLENSITKFEKTNELFSILMVDIDFFKKINDQFGHDCGDFVLQEISGVFKKFAEKDAYISRWGGEEFLVLLPDCDAAAAFSYAEKIRTTIESHAFICGKNIIKITLTLGLSTYTSPISLDQIVKEADIAVYNGKKNGRNRTEVFASATP
jgi:diguanylate cyclase (GGDEF)-like protein